MRSELFDYPLPPERIAQTPVEPRDASRLLVLRRDGAVEHRRFLDLPDLLNPGDLLVFNDTRVLPARLFGRKETGARVEALLLRRVAPCLWEALAYPGRRLQEGARVRFGEGELTAEVAGIGPEGTRLLRFEGEEEEVDRAIHRLGEVPLPPYIHERLGDPERYQTLYAREEGSAAAPTAGLHFTPRVFQALEEKGVRFAYVTLHVGIATFRPIKAEEIEQHEMHAEWFHVPEETARAIRECPGRVVAVGTTSVRALESWASGLPIADCGLRIGDPNAQHPTPDAFHETRLYITPGYRFRVVDCLLTNFHMPRSSLMVLVSAFAGVEPIRRAYEEALREGYRFLSFGDAMFIEGAG